MKHWNRMIYSHPTSEALTWLKTLAPIVEMGYGDGRWMKAMADAGIRVAGIELGDGNSLDRYPGWTVFASWPPESLVETWFGGRTFVFVGDEQRYSDSEGNFFDHCQILHKAPQPEGEKDSNRLIVGKHPCQQPMNA